jgi:hypothetical protein
MAKRWKKRPEGSNWGELTDAVGSPVTPVATV